MNTTHIVIGAKVGAYFQQIINQVDQFSGKLLVIEDDLSIGPLKDEVLSFSELRSKFWNTLEKQSKNHIFNDLEAIIDLSSALTNNEVDRVVLWIAPTAQDLSSFYFVLFFLKKHIDKLQLISINGLPFLDDDLKLYFPNNFLDVNKKGIIKATKLMRAITYSELELGIDEWVKLRTANANVRIVTKMNALHSSSDEEIFQFVLSKFSANSIKHAALLKQLNPNSNTLKDLYFTSVLETLVHTALLSFDNNLYTKE